jgi:hypoxanthine phosphoribosyltransferase
VVLKGAFIFLADLIRRLSIPCEVDFCRLASYSGTESCGEIRITKDLEMPVAGRDVLVVEDILDTGLTLACFTEILRRRGPASLRVCAFLDKEERRRVPFQADYVGFAVPDRFIVGYGLDCNERYRYLPDLCILREGN